MTILKDTIHEDGEDIAIYIEVDEKTSSPYGDTRGSGSAIKDIGEAIEQAMATIHTCAKQAANAIKTIPEGIRPSGYEMQLAIKFDAEVGAMIAKISSEAQLQVTLKWDKVS